MSLDQIRIHYLSAWGPEQDPVEYANAHSYSPQQRCWVFLADQFLRWQSGRPRPVEFYLGQWPQGDELAELRIRLLVDEFGYREQYGQPSKVESFLAELKSENETQLNALRQALAASSDGMDRSAARIVSGASHKDNAPQDTAELEQLESVAHIHPKGLTTQDDLLLVDSISDESIQSGEMERIDRTLIPGFELLEEIGKGAFGIVYRARDRQLERDVAIKFMRYKPQGESLQSLESEARRVARLDCQGIVPVFQAGRLRDGTRFMVTKFIRGGNLAQRIRAGKVDPDFAARLTLGCARALIHAHDQMILHRDIKPANILIDEHDKPWITDFGLALTDEERLERGDDVSGTPAYMSPEQITTNATELDHRTDIWSLGVVLYEMLSGRPPFMADSYDAVFDMIQHDAARPLVSSNREISKSLALVCERCLRKEPSERYASASDLADALEALVHSEPTASASDSNPHSIVLRIKGTPFLYLPDPATDQFVVGRQRRKTIGAQSVGSDFVVRCADDTQHSLQISREHFQIRRVGEHYELTDQSKVGTELNGVKLSAHAPQVVQAGDEIVIGRALTIEVLATSDRVEYQRLKNATIDRLGTGEPRMILEASMGDLTTMEPPDSTSS